MTNRKNTLISMGIVAGVASSALLSGSPAQALTTINLAPSDFTGNVISGSAVAITDLNSAINTTITRDTATLALPSGFAITNGTPLFTSSFLLLGNGSTGGAITSQTAPTPNNVNSIAYSNPFTIPNNIDPIGGLTVSFTWALTGTLSGASTYLDSFDVQLLDYDSINGNGNNYVAAILNQTTRGTNTASVPIPAVLPGEYVLQISLTENSAANSGNSAAGFNNIQIQFDQIPFDFSATPGLLILGGMFGGSYLIKRRKQGKLE